MAKDKYEVVDYEAGGFFIHGGSLGHTYFQNDADARLVCEALNLGERLKMRRVQNKLADALCALDALEKGLKEEEISRY